MIVIDYETRSTADLPTVGAYNYATDPTTDILCLALYDTDTDESIVFDPAECDMPGVWADKLSTELVAAHNATFDRLIHEHVGVAEYAFPEIEYDRWYCTSAQCRINALPANLEDAAKAAKVADLKDPRGKQLIKLLSLPQEDGSFNESPGLMAEMRDYCLKDVKATVAIYRATRPLTQNEHADWLMCERMNDNGVMIDRELATLATTFAAQEQADIAGKLSVLTEGVITKPTQHQRIKKYVMEAIKDSDDDNDIRLLKLMTVYKSGEKKISLDKDVRQDILTAVEDGGLNLYTDIEDLIRLLDAASASSVAKFNKMLGLAHPVDDRVRGAFIHAGAGQTHRFSSKGLQLHNMKRKCFNAEKTTEIVNQMRTGQLPDVMQTLSKLLRPALIPRKGHVFIVGDWSAIEGRCNPWLSDSKAGEKKLDLYRQGIDTYIENAKKIFNTLTVEDSQRQVGKVAELALGYQGAVGAFYAMAKNYGVDLPEYMVRKIVRKWRIDNMWAVDFWAELEAAAKRAIRAQGSRSFTAGRVVYKYAPKLLGGTLLCSLPCGTTIQYPFARIVKGSITALKASMKPKKEDKKHWGEVSLYGGIFCENCSQAFAASLLRHLIKRMGVLRKYLVAHVHDEVILEVPAVEAQKVCKQLKMLMEAAPAFAKGLPLKAEPVILERYGNH